VVAPLPLGRRFVDGALVAGRYRIAGFLGRGGMGEVYAADDVELGTRVAVKVLLPGRFDDARGVELLRAELATARRITHAGVCRVFDVKDHDGTPFFTMELLVGETLAARLERGPLRWADARPLVDGVCSALAAAHAAGVAHRDLKPHNVMLCGERAVITDFGLAAAGDGAGTRGYAAPEVATGGRGTPAADVYALGVTVVHVLTGDVRSSEVARARLAVDPAWAAALDRCLATDPAARPSAVELARLPRARPVRGRAHAWAAVAAAGGVALALATGAVSTTPRDGDGDVAIALRGPGREKVEAVVFDAGGDAYVVGHAGRGARIGGVPLSVAVGTELAVVARLDPSGAARWTRAFGATSRFSLSAVAVDRAAAPRRIFVTGNVSRGDVDLGDGPREVVVAGEAFLVGLSPHDGATVWRRSLVGATALVRAMSVGPDGFLYAVGEHEGCDFGDGRARPTTGPAPFLASYDRDGGLRWVLAGTRSDNVRARTLAFVDDLVIVGGSAAGVVEVATERWQAGDIREAFAFAVDRSTGELRWARAFSGPSEVWAIVRRGDDLVVSGSHDDDFRPAPDVHLSRTAGRTGAWLARLSPSTGEVRWAGGLGSPEASWSARMLAVLPDGRLVAGGAFSGTLAAGGRTVTARGTADGYLALLDPEAGDPSAIVRRVATLPGPGVVRMRGIALAGDDSLVAWGRHDGATIADRRHDSEGLSDGFVVELRLAQLFP
jgi:outer membrane protein assembly factor BamB